MTKVAQTFEALIEAYLKGLYEGDHETLAAIFHPTADLRWQEEGKLQILTVEDWLTRVKGRKSAKTDGHAREDFVITIDRADENIALVKLRSRIPPRYFTDYLIGARLEDGWKVVSKVYRYDLIK